MPKNRPLSIQKRFGLGHTRKTALYMALLIAVSVSQYANIIGHGFVWDSIGVFVEDTSIRDVGNIPEFFTKSFTLGEDVEGGLKYLKYYRPLVKLLHLAEYGVFGQEPIGYKFMSILLNTIAVVLGFLFVRGLTGSTATALVASLLYAVNPSRAEAVSWSYSDSYLLMSVFVLLSLISYHRGRQGIALLMFGCALLSWEGSILLPAVIVAYEALIRKSREARAFSRAAMFFALAAVYLVLRHFIAGKLPITDVPLPAYINTVLVIVKTAIRAAFVPEAPVTIYMYRPYGGMTAEVWISYLVTAGVAVLAAFLWKRDRESMFWLAWFFIWLVISFNVGALADYLFADKYLVLAVLGPCVLLARTLEFRGRAQAVASILIAALFVYHFGMTFDRNRYYKDTITYIEKGLEHEPDLKIGIFTLGTAYKKAGDFDRALENYMTLLTRYEGAPKMVSAAIAQTYFEKAKTMVDRGEFSAALVAYEKSLLYMPGDSRTYNNIGNSHLMIGNYERALENWRKASKLDPANPEPLYNIGMALERSGDYSGAIDSYLRFAGTGHPMGQKALERVADLKAKGHRLP